MLIFKKKRKKKMMVRIIEGLWRLLSYQEIKMSCPILNKTLSRRHNNAIL
jgi:hypothetical protein